jgi:effector-binding domain-containing protein
MPGGYVVTQTRDLGPERVGRPDDDEISIRREPQHLLAAARQRTTFERISQEIGPLLEPVWAFIREHPGLRTDGHSVAVYWDEAGEGFIEVGVQVVRTFAATDAVVNSATPGGLVATTAYYGPYSELGLAHQAVRVWCKTKGYELAGPFWEVYVHGSDDPAELRTDVFYLLHHDPSAT